MTMEDAPTGREVRFYAELLSLRETLFTRDGVPYSVGWVAHAFKDRFGYFPPTSWRRDVVPADTHRGAKEWYRERERKRCEEREREERELKNERARERAKEKRARERGQTHAPADEPGATLETFFDKE